MVFSSIRRSITHSARSKLNRNVISGSYNWRNTLRHDSFPPSLTPLGNACVDGCVGILRGYIAYNGAGKQLLSKAYMSNLKSVLGIPRIRRLFSSQGPGKKTLQKLLSEKQEGNSERGRTEISVQRGIRCRWSGEYSGTVFEADSRFIAPLMFIGFIVTSLFLNPHQTKEISFQEFKNKLLEPGLVNHVEVANKSVAKVYMRSSACEKVHSDDSVRDTVNGSPSEGNVTQFKYYFNIGSVQSFEEKLEGAQEALGIDRHDFVPVIYVSQVMWSKELLRYGPTMLLLGALWFMSRKMPSIGGPGGKSGRGIFNIGKAQVTKLDKNAKNKVLFKDVAGCDEAKQEIMEFVHFLKHPKKYEELGAKIPKGALLVGHPGTGKTLLAKATADESGVPFLSISGADFMEMFVGVGTSRVQSLFQEARQCAPSIIFIDEIDAIGWARGHGGFSGGHGERESTLNQLLVELDGFGTTAGVVGLAGSVALIGLIFWIKLS